MFILERTNNHKCLSACARVCANMRVVGFIIAFIQFDVKTRVERDVGKATITRFRATVKQTTGNEERRDRSKTGRTMVLLTFDEEESPIRHYYKRHFINRKRVISCQIDLLAFVKVRNYDGSRIYHVKRIASENSIGKYLAARV